MDYTKPVSETTNNKLLKTQKWRRIDYPLPSRDLRFLFYLRLDDDRNRETIREISRFYSNRTQPPETIKK